MLIVRFVLPQSLFELELAGCNEVTEAGLWSCLTPRIVSLSLADCINIADEAVGAVAQLLPSLYEFSLQVSVAVRCGFVPQFVFSILCSISRLRAAGLPRDRRGSGVLFAEAEPQPEHTAVAILLGADQPWHCQYR